MEAQNIYKLAIELIEELPTTPWIDVDTHVERHRNNNMNSSITQNATPISTQNFSAEILPITTMGLVTIEFNSTMKPVNHTYFNSTNIAIEIIDSDNWAENDQHLLNFTWHTVSFTSENL